jgi:membrane protein YdbS with pleckstrin-like domain
MEITDAHDLYRAGRLHEAHSVYSSLLEGSDSAAAYYGLGVIAITRKNNQDAIAYLRQSINIRPTASAAYYAGTCYEEADDIANAIAFYRRATSLQPGMRLAAEALARLAGGVGAGNPGDNPAAELPERPAASPGDSASGRSGRTVAAEIAEGLAPSPGKQLAAGYPSLRGKLSPFQPVAAAAVVWLALHAAVVAAIGGPAFTAALATAEHLTGAVLAVLAVLMLGYAAASCRTTRYIVTDHRIEVRSGIVARSQHIVWLWQVNAPVDFHQTLAQRILNTGEITVQSAHDPAAPTDAPAGHAGQLQIIGIRDAHGMRDLAEELRTAALRERREMLANLMGR